MSGAGGCESFRRHLRVVGAELPGNAPHTRLAKEIIEDIEAVPGAPEQVFVVLDRRRIGIDRARRSRPGDVLAPAPASREHVTGIAHAVAGCAVPHAGVREDVLVQHPKAVSIGSRVQERIEGQHLLWPRGDGARRQILVEIDAEARRLAGGIEPRPVDQFENHLFAGGNFRHRQFLLALE